MENRDNYNIQEREIPSSSLTGLVQNTKKINGCKVKGISNYNLTGLIQDEFLENLLNIESSAEEKELNMKIYDMIKNASTKEDLNDIGRELNYANDNGMYNIDATDLQIYASRKMRELIDAGKISYKIGDKD